MQIPHTCQGVLTQHIDEAIEATLNKTTRLPEGGQPLPCTLPRPRAG